MIFYSIQIHKNYSLPLIPARNLKRELICRYTVVCRYASEMSHFI